MDIFGVATFLMLVTGCRAPPCEDNPVAVWPLGTGDGCTEIMTGDTLGTIGNVEYVSGFTNIGMNSSAKFFGENNSYIDLNVSSTDINDLSAADFSMWFYILFDSITSGTFLHYRSYSYNGTPVSDEIREFRVSISGGILNFDYSGFGSVQDSVALNISDWYNIVIERDISKDGPKVYMNDTGTNLDVSADFQDVPTIFPGTLRLGGSFEEDDQFSGKIACFQFIPCKQATHAMYDGYCATQRTTTTSTTTTTAQTTTTTTTEQPTTTTTTEQPPTTTTSEQPTTTTTSEQPTTTSTTEQTTTTSTTEQPTTTSTTEQPTTTSTTEQPTTTTTTEQPPTTTTSEQPTTTTTSEQPTTTSTTEQPTTTWTTEQTTTISTTEQPTTTSTTEQPTTEQPTTTTTTAQTTTTTTTEQSTTTSTTEQPTSISTTEQPTTTTQQSFVKGAATAYSLITDVCYHFTLTGTNVTFRFNSDIIDIIQVSNIVSCSDYCRKYLLCFSFTIASVGVGTYECRIGLKSPLTISRPGSKFYEL